MIKILYSLIVGVILTSCSHSEKLNIKYCTDFNYDFIDSLSSKNNNISQFIQKHKVYLLYVTDGFCSECIYNLITFVKNKEKIPIPCIYIVNSEDFVLFDYYAKLNKLENLLHYDLIEKSTSDMFHTIEPESFAGNQLLVIDNKNDNIISLPTNPFANKNMTLDFINLVNHITGWRN